MSSSITTSRANSSALVHQYVRPDGSLGGSGQPDPKLLIEEGVTYIPDDSKGGSA